MAETSSLITLPINLGSRVNDYLKTKIQFVPRKNTDGTMSFEFTKEELAMVDRIDIINPLAGGYLEGIELLPNLKTLRIMSNGSHLENSYYKEENYTESITDEDCEHISKCKNLENLAIVNQPKISRLDVSNMPKLRGFYITRNARLQEISGLDSLKNLVGLELYGNESLVQIKDLDKVIMGNRDLDNLSLDVLLYPDAIAYGTDINRTNAVLQRLSRMSDSELSWREELAINGGIKINNTEMMRMHQIACNAIDEYVPPSAGKITTIVGIEQYLSENVVYDHKSIEGKKTHSHSSLCKANGIEISMLVGPQGGANGAFNAFVYGTCVCEGYTRAMQYLLRLKGIKSHNVHNIADKVELPTVDLHGFSTDDLHSCICIDDFHYLYDDPCWNACYYQQGDTSLPYTLLTKNQISRDHTLSHSEDKINDEDFMLSRHQIDSCREAITYRVQQRKAEEEEARRIGEYYRQQREAENGNVLPQRGGR
jgi:hypothetical protein